MLNIIKYSYFSNWQNDKNIFFFCLFSITKLYPFFSACISVASDTNPSSLEILTVRPRKVNPSKVFLWKIDNKTKGVSTIDDKFYWDLQVSRYVNYMPVELYERTNNANQQFVFVKVN